MDQVTIKAELQTRADYYIKDDNPSYSYECNLDRTNFDRDTENNNVRTIRVTHYYRVICKSDRDFETEFDEFVRYYLSRDRITLDSEYIYPNITDYRTELQDTQTYFKQLDINITYEYTERN